MKKMIFLFLVLMAVAILQGVYYYQILPDQLASHFGENGMADGWQSKTAFYATYYGMVFILALCFLSIPLVIDKIPPAMLNLPNKNYWLEESRRGGALQTYVNFMLIMGSATLVFMMAVIQLVFNLNAHGQSRLPSTFWFLLIVYAAFVILQTVILWVRFKVPKAS